ncbi:PucR family transcriptional regulator [Streptacidiphilus sp. PB12-B1b]|uniref:helix-turn-helix domain-containing protein n=1 Tax=Streptacidiphilus sp. PB12-B1b TaxID=2705012 RepID=UPI0015F809D5|nr:helix-turn-helix domain-containing protein [Streptacidiphilus sp. PB12-B1b]QMU77997.1 PucR family transcriptional regulator [Streptacidiphilus sp. PB12-B1b]
MEHRPSESLDAQVERLGARMLRQADDLADRMAARIRAAVPRYGSDAAVSAEELRRTCLENVRFIFGPLGSAPALSSPESRENGRRRARAGVPLTAVMEAYRVGARFLWDRLAETAAHEGVPAEATVRAASEMWLVLDTYTQHMAEGYREEVTAQTLRRDQERSAVVEALLEGRLAGAELWDAAAILRIPPQGPYVVIAAQVTDIGSHALPGAEEALRSIGAASAWRLLHDTEVGIARLPRGAGGLDRLAAVVAGAAVGRVGVSPVYGELKDTAAALRLARIALHAAFEGQAVTVFDRAPLAIAAACAPEVMQRVAHGVLAGLDALPGAQRALLLETFGAWLDHGGSADRTAAALFCHPNTVRHRLRRLEERTGRALSEPRDVAELSLAFETDRRLGRAGPSAEPAATGD